MSRTDPSDNENMSVPSVHCITNQSPRSECDQGWDSFVIAVVLFNYITDLCWPLCLCACWGLVVVVLGQYGQGTERLIGVRCRGGELCVCVWSITVWSRLVWPNQVHWTCVYLHWHWTLRVDWLTHSRVIDQVDVYCSRRRSTSNTCASRRAVHTPTETIGVKLGGKILSNCVPATVWWLVQLVLSDNAFNLHILN